MTESEARPDAVEEIFHAIRRHVLTQLAQLPPDAEGMVAFSPQVLAVTILAASLQLCEEMKVERKDIERCVDEVLKRPRLVLC